VTKDKPEAVPFKALPLNRNILSNKQVGRLSVPPPKLTEAIGFNLSYQMRDILPKKRLHIEEPQDCSFKARKMPHFLKPSSPTKSTRSIDFKEFNLATKFRERQSAPPLMQ